MDLEIAFIPGMPARNVVELVRRAEALGFQAVHIPDQTFHRDPFALLALCAQSTTRIGLGLSVTNPYTRHPIQIARAAGLLAELSGGRFRLGLGTGNRPRVLAGFGMEQRSMVVRVREAVDVIRRLLAGETVHHRSATLTVNGVRLDFQVDQPVPIYIGTRGPRLLRLGGEMADGVMAEALFADSAVAYAKGCVEEGAVAAGRPPTAVRFVAWQALFVGDDGLAESLRCRRWAALLISTTRPDVLALIGVPEEVRDRVRAEVAEVGIEEAAPEVPVDVVRKLMLVGPPATVRRQLDELAGRGVDAAASIVMGGYQEVRDTMERFAEVLR